ncbi:MAG: hypothetical protein J1E38_04435 [Paramuribaculum sp.]|nr:hypothetical protein [Paramuribaculum sp.]
MKKVVLSAAVAIIAALGLNSCSTISNSAYTQVVGSSITNVSYADLEVSPKIITYKFDVNESYSRAGEKSCKMAAVQKALQQNGGGDVIVNPQFEVKKTRRFIFGSKISYVIVTGHPAVYKNVHPMNKQEAEIITTLNSGKKK